MTDLTIGFGAVFLGHGYPPVVRRLHDQIDQIWLCGRVPTAIGAEAQSRIAEILPAGFEPGGLYSTGMEVSEFAMRLAAHHSGRREFAGFARSMHGKSAMSAALCWENAPIRPDCVHILPFVDQLPEEDVLEQLSLRLSSGRIAALFVEPIQGSNGGHEASREFYCSLIAMCRETGTYCILDEILSGLYRTGTAFYADRLELSPDFLLFAKSMGNGFPVSSLAIPRGMTLAPQALPGSTFSGNPLAAAAVSATLEAMSELPMTERVNAIERTVRTILGGREAEGITLRGRGAFWTLDLADEVHVSRALAEIRRSGVLVSSRGRYIRILPAATIDTEVLAGACGRILAACASARA